MRGRGCRRAMSIHYWLGGSLAFPPSRYGTHLLRWPSLVFSAERDAFEGVRSYWGVAAPVAAFFRARVRTRSASEVRHGRKTPVRMWASVAEWGQEFSNCFWPVACVRIQSFQA
jgi:hypothetical protein